MNILWEQSQLKFDLVRVGMRAWGLLRGANIFLFEDVNQFMAKWGGSLDILMYRFFY